jgi:hypothetical protein
MIDMSVENIVRRAVREAAHNSSRRGRSEDDLDILRRDAAAWRELQKVFRGADDSPSDYEWHITADGYKGKGKAVDERGRTIKNEFTSLVWNGVEWMIGDWEWE